MGLKLVKESDFGVDVAYWNIGAKAEDFKAGGKQITLFGYLNKEARDSGAQPMMATQVTIANGLYVPDQNRDGDYLAIKRLEEWKNAEDE